MTGTPLSLKYFYFYQVVLLVALASLRCPVIFSADILRVFILVIYLRADILRVVTKKLFTNTKQVVKVYLLCSIFLSSLFFFSFLFLFLFFFFFFFLASPMACKSSGARDRIHATPLTQAMVVTIRVWILNLLCH